MIKLSLEQRAHIHPLFANFGLRLHGVVAAVSSSDFGCVWADDVDGPKVALAHIDFWLVGGDAGHPEAAEALRMVTKGSIITDGTPAWEELVRATLPKSVSERTRTAMRTPLPDAWNRDQLSKQAASLPAGIEIRRIVAENVAAFAAVAHDFVHHFRNSETYLAQGLGFGVFDGQRCVAGCSSYTLANGKLEIEVDTGPEYRRRGFARAVAATLILHCLDHGIQPCWDAHNQGPWP